MKPFRLAILLTLALLCLGCSKSRDLLAPQPLTGAEFDGASYHLLAKNATESVILLGQLRFQPMAGEALAGTWELRQWSGADVPALPSNGVLSGTVFGSTAVIRLHIPGTESSLGLIAEGIRNGRVTGSIALLPSKRFQGRFEAIRSGDPAAP